MAATTRKRKATRSLADDTKRQRINIPSPEESTIQSEDDEDHVYKDNQDKDDSSEDNDEADTVDTADTADTPLTPFSPGRKKFPSELKTIKCTWEGCDKTFNRPARLEAHLRSHTNDRPFVCTFEGCDKSYLQEKHLRQHIKGSHTSERPYPCDWGGCAKSFLTATRLRRHKEAHEGHERFRCTAYPPCNQTFRKHQTLQRHIRSDHLELAPYPCTLIDDETMEPCLAGFDGAAGLRRHVETTHTIPQFFCPECIISPNPDGSPQHLGFKNNYQLQAHIKKDHAQCPFCDRKCSSKPVLDAHIESQHSGTSLSERKNIACIYDGCTKAFTKKSNLTAHVKAAHEGQRYICGTFNLSTTLDIEVSIWDGANSCNNDFVSKASLVDHIRTQHLNLPSVVNAKRKSQVSKPRVRKPKTDAIDELIGNSYGKDKRRNVSCVYEDCTSKFTRMHDLKRHLRAKHRLADEEINDLDFNQEPDERNLEVENENEVGFAAEDDREGLDAMYNAVQTSWETRDLENGAETPFWIGADDGPVQDEGQEQWLREELEMRSLIDEGGLGGYFDDGGFGII